MGELIAKVMGSVICSEDDGGGGDMRGVYCMMVVVWY